MPNIEELRKLRERDNRLLLYSGLVLIGIGTILTCFFPHVGGRATILGHKIEGPVGLNFGFIGLLLVFISRRRQKEDKVREKAIDFIDKELEQLKKQNDAITVMFQQYHYLITEISREFAQVQSLKLKKEDLLNLHNKYLLLAVNMTKDIVWKSAVDAGPGEVPNCALLLPDAKKKFLRSFHTFYSHFPRSGSGKLPLKKSVAGRSFQDGKAIACKTIKRGRCRRWFYRKENGESSIVSLLCIPVFNLNTGSVFEVLSLDSDKEDFFTKEMIEKAKIISFIISFVDNLYRHSAAELEKK